MRPQIPDHADVPLMETQVDPARRNEENVADRAGFEQALHSPHRRAVDKRVTAHQDPSLVSGERRKVVRKLAGGCERLLDEHVLARLERSSRKVVVSMYRRSDHHRFDARVVEHTLDARGHARRGDAPSMLRQTLSVEIADPADLGVGVLGDNTQQIWSPIPEADHCHADGRRDRWLQVRNKLFSRSQHRAPWLVTGFCEIAA